MDSFSAASTLDVSGNKVKFFKLGALDPKGEKLRRLPYSIKVLLENLLRHEDGRVVTKGHIQALLDYDAKAAPTNEIAFYPARVLLQDFTGVPAVADLAGMRDAITEMGGDPKNITPLQTADLVIDHSIQVDHFASPLAPKKNTDIEYARNQERYGFLRWGQQAFDNFRVVPPSTGICHQVNLEYLASVVMKDKDGVAYPDTLVGTDSHTVMINGLGVLGWGVGGIEAEAAMLGQPLSMLVPQVVGFKLTGKVKEGTTATDIVLTATQMLRAKGVVGKFVEFFGPGLSELALPDRATLANMAPEYGATMGFVPVDDETLNYLRFSGRPEAQVKLVEAYCKAQGLFVDPKATPEFTDVLELDLGTVEPCLAGPKRPQDRIVLSDMKKAFTNAMSPIIERDKGDAGKKMPVELHGQKFELGHGATVIAAITSCTNTSNPAVMLAAGLLAKKAVEKGLKVKPWVKTSLAPGSKVVTDYLIEAGLMEPLSKLGFDLVGYGCTTCIGNSGPLHAPIARAIEEGDLVAASVLSGNRNFEGRVSPHCRMNFLASPPLVVAYALKGTVDANLTTDSLGEGSDGKPVYLKDIWPTNQEIRDTVRTAVKSEHFEKEYAVVFEGDEQWRSLDVPKGSTFVWDDKSTYVRRPPFFDNVQPEPTAPTDIEGARVLALLGDSVTTDHISPAGGIAKDSPAAKYLESHGVDRKDYNSYGSRRGNHEVMMRGTFANIRLRNQLAPGTEGGITLKLPGGEQTSIYDAAMQYAEEKVPLLVLAGAEYGMGSSRDWAAKGTRLLGVRAVLAKSYERIHRSNLVGMGVLPLEFEAGQDVTSLGLTGKETFSVTGIAKDLSPGKRLEVTATSDDGQKKTFGVVCRIDTLNEVDYYQHGGILLYVLRQLAKKD